MNTCFLDMDGVLADFVAGVCAAHGRPDPYSSPENLGIWDMEKIWGISVSEFFAPTRGEEFWTGLRKTDMADDLTGTAIRLFGVDNVAVLTAPSLDPTSISGKKKWMANYYPDLKNNLVFSAKKHFMAGPDKILVDDRDLNVDQFSRAGGVSILLPRTWNRRHVQSSDIVISELTEAWRTSCVV